jgi:segregation and condensation protein A
MRTTQLPIFTIGSFAGTLDLLLALVQRCELPIAEIPLKELTNQFITISDKENSLDQGAEFVGAAAFLIWLKSKTLRPVHEQSLISEEEIDPHFEIIHHLVDYCRFKEAAKTLIDKEQKRGSLYFRGASEALEAKKNLGIEHLSIEDFATLFRQIASKASQKSGVVHEETWRVADKIQYLHTQLSIYSEIALETVFSADKCREELIVTFLAILELMKEGHLAVIRETTSGAVKLIGTKHIGTQHEARD